MSKCVFAGTFDPFTIGHADVVDKCLQIFDEVVVAILINKDKKQLFPTDVRENMIKSAYKNNDRVKVVSYDGLLVELLEKENTNVCVRGVRNSVDFEYEKNLHYVNADLKKDVITIFIQAEQKHLHVSGSAVRTLLAFGKPVDDYLPEEVAEIVKNYLKEEK